MLGFRMANVGCCGAASSSMTEECARVSGAGWSQQQSGEHHHRGSTKTKNGPQHAHYGLLDHRGVGGMPGDLFGWPQPAHNRVDTAAWTPLRLGGIDSDPFARPRQQEPPLFKELGSAGSGTAAADEVADVAEYNVSRASSIDSNTQRYEPSTHLTHPT